MKLTAHDMPRSYWQRRATGNGVPASTFSCRLRKGWTPQRAATEPVKEYPKRGKGGECLAVRARQAGIDPAMVHRRLRQGWPLERALEAEAGSRKTATVADKARAAGLDPHVVSCRLRYGWSLDKALSTPVMTRSEAARKAGQAGQARRQQIQQQTQERRERMGSGK